MYKYYGYVCTDLGVLPALDCTHMVGRDGSLLAGHGVVPPDAGICESPWGLYGRIRSLSFSTCRSLSCLGLFFFLSSLVLSILSGTSTASARAALK